MMKQETRYLPLELRIAEHGGRTLVGMIPYNKRSVDLGGFAEVIAPGAFAEALQPGADVRCIWNHGTSDVLGRTTSGTLSLSDSPEGLQFRCDLPDTAVGRDVATLAQRRDVAGASFGFVCLKDEWSKDAGLNVRTLRKVAMYEISPTSFPAYPDTTVALRSCPSDLLGSNALSESECIRLHIKLALKQRTN